MTPEQVPDQIAEIAARGRYKVYSDALPFLGPWEELPEDYRKASVDVMRAPLAAVLGEHAALVLEAHADDVDREIAEAVAKSNLADVRCVDCNLRYEERQEYGCESGRRGHTYDATDIEIAKRVDVVATYGANEIRKKAAEYREGKRS